jgi:imidazolonepropionase-like amidohydrolase
LYDTGDIFARIATKPILEPISMRRILVVLLLSAAALAQTAPRKSAPNPPRMVYVRAGRLLDMTGDAARQNVVIVVRDDRIDQVAPAAQVQIPAGAAVVDLSNATVLPGLIDCHTHLTGRADQYNELLIFKWTPFKAGMYGEVNARKTLLAGFTTVRDVGSAPFAAVDLRDTINEGFIPGPRIVASGPGISITGGHGDLNNFSPLVSMEMFAGARELGIADGPEQLRHTIRAQVKYGVDVIKILATGGVLSKGDSPGASHYTIEELKIAADTAHMLGRKIAAHAHGTEGIKNAILAGIDSVEHASLADEEDMRLAKEHGTYFVMDIYNDDYLLGKAIEFGLPQENVDKEKMVGRLQREHFRQAVQMGVKMAFGTDAGVYPHGDNGKQFAKMVEWGMTPIQAIRAATVSAADLIGRSKDVGSIEPGKYADLIAVTGDPLQDVRVLESVGFVMKGGTIYKDNVTGKHLAAGE